MTLLKVPGRDILEVLDDRDRYNKESTTVVSHVKVEGWHERISDPTIADTILDRLVHNADRLKLKGESPLKLRRSRCSGIILGL